jgi:adhesin/invasin
MIRFTRHLPLAGTLVALAACGHDSSTTTSPGSNLTGFAIVIDSVSQGQTAVVGSTITIGFRVMNSSVTAGVPNQSVTLTPATGSGTVSTSPVTTDANGHATASWTLGTISGTVTLSIIATGVTVPATATALADKPTKLQRVSTDSQTVVASGSVSLVVKSTDQFGNPVPNVNVTWSSSAGTVTPTATTTGPAGNAAITFTTGPVPATYTINATSPGLTPISFTLKGS